MFIDPNHNGMYMKWKIYTIAHGDTFALATVLRIRQLSRGLGPWRGLHGGSAPCLRKFSVSRAQNVDLYITHYLKTHLEGINRPITP